MKDYPDLERICEVEHECPACPNIIKVGDREYLDMEYYEVKGIITYCCEDCAEADQ